MDGFVSALSDPSLRAQRSNLLTRNRLCLASLPFALPGRGTFLCFAKEKYPKERRPEGLPAARVPCASRPFARSPNSPPENHGRLKHEARLIANGLRCSAAPTGERVNSKRSVYFRHMRLSASPEKVCFRIIETSLRTHGVFQPQHISNFF